ncbi:type II secretion system F family protein [Clostridium thailandense]|uniref:type II secretion system F family protein n=1 Tax=Clostridium thailandense TaxID=2794346 RepID=UPI00398941D0
MFSYKAVNINGNKIKGEFEGENILELRAVLKDSGYYLLDFKNKNGVLKNILKRRVGLKDISFLCNALGNMLSSGITISQALNVIASQCNNKILKQSLYNIERNVSKGESIHKSLKNNLKIYPLFMAEMVKAGEEVGKLDKVLTDLSIYYDEQNKILTKIKSAIAYPLIVLTSSIFIIMFLMIKIVPQFTDTIRSMGGKIPLLTQTTLNFCNFIRNNFCVINMCVILSIIILYKYFKTNKGKIFIDKMKLKIPCYRTMYNYLVLSKLSRALSMLISSGSNIIRALEISLSIINNKIIENKTRNCIEDIKKGECIYYAFKKHDIGNEMFLAMIKTGEEVGRLDTMLLRTATIFESEFKERLKMLLSLMEPSIIIILAFFIGIFIISAIIPIITIMDSIA